MKIVSGSWNDTHGYWTAEIDSGSNALGNTITLVVTLPDGTQQTRLIADGYQDGDVTNAGGPAAYIDAVVIPDVNSSIAALVNSYATNSTPTSQMLALLGSVHAIQGSNPPQLQPL